MTEKYFGRSQSVSHGNKPVTLKHLAQTLDIHVSTVSRVLNGDPDRVHEAASTATVERIQALARALEYRPNLQATNLKLQQSREIGVLMPRLSDLVMATVYDGIDEAVQQAGFTSFVINTLDNPERQLVRARQALQMRVAGLLISDIHTGHGQPLLKLLKEKRTPFVLVYRPHGNHPSVTGDDEMGGSQAAQHLYERGHRCVGVLAGYDFAQSSIDRTSAFVGYYRSRGIVVPETAIMRGAVDTATGRGLSAELFRRHPEITAVFAINDFLAIGCMGVVRDLGRNVGTDIAIVGYNDTPIAAELPVALTSVYVPTLELGRQAAQMLLRRISGNVVTSIRLSTELRVRRSSELSVTDPAWRK